MDGEDSMNLDPSERPDMYSKAFIKSGADNADQNSFRNLVAIADNTYQVATQSSLMQENMIQDSKGIHQMF